MRLKSILCVIVTLTLTSRECIAETVGPFDLDHLFAAPEFRWVGDGGGETATGGVKSLIYAGEPVEGMPTDVFAFYASPATLGKSAAGPYPGVVLVHGGGGTAFAEWAHLWAERGYAAIAMDLSGHRPELQSVDSADGELAAVSTIRSPRSRLQHGGLDQGRSEKFDCVKTDDISDDWPYHAVCSVIKAHSLLRSFEEVDADRTAITGISWGGYTTCFTASVDHRFKAAVPVYGCGFLHEGESVQKPAIDGLGNDDGLGTDREKWVKLYDVSSWLRRCRVPILFVNGTNDVHYVLDSYQKSFEVVPGDKQMRVEVNMRHGHQPGWAPAEIGLFIDSHCRDGRPLAKVASPVVTAEGVRARFESPVPVTSAQLHYTTDEGLRSKRRWISVDAVIEGQSIVAPKLPDDANTWFVSVVDERGAMVSSDVGFR